MTRHLALIAGALQAAALLEMVWRWPAQALRSHCSPSCAASTRPPRSDSAARTLEAAIIVMGVLAMLGLIAVEKPRSGSAVPQADCTT